MVDVLSNSELKSFASYAIAGSIRPKRLLSKALLTHETNIKSMNDKILENH